MFGQTRTKTAKIYNTSGEVAIANIINVVPGQKLLMADVALTDVAWTNCAGLLVNGTWFHK